MALAATTQESTRVRSSAERCMARAISSRGACEWDQGSTILPHVGFFFTFRERQLTADFFADCNLIRRKRRSN